MTFQFQVDWKGFDATVTISDHRHGASSSESPAICSAGSGASPERLTSTNPSQIACRSAGRHAPSNAAPSLSGAPISDPSSRYDHRWYGQTSVDPDPAPSSSSIEPRWAQTLASTRTLSPSRTATTGRPASVTAIREPERSSWSTRHTGSQFAASTDSTSRAYTPGST